MAPVAPDHVSVKPVAEEAVWLMVSGAVGASASVVAVKGLEGVEPFSLVAVIVTL